MRSWLLLGVLVALAACDSGGSSGPALPPVPPWGNFRHDVLNSAASGTLDNTMGCVSNPIDLGGTTLSTPTIDLSGNILIGTKKGLQAYDPNCFAFPANAPCTSNPASSDHCPIWTLSECQLSCQPEGCTPPDPIPIGSISNSPTVTAGDTIVFSTDPTDSEPGRVFSVTEQGNDPPVCNWVYPLPAPGEENVVSRSSAVVQINASDFTLATAVVGGADGVLRALNADGSVRWEFATGSSEPITGTPALDPTNTAYIVSPDGVVAAINFAGGVTWLAQVGMPPGVPPPVGCAGDPTATAGCFQASVGVGPSIYALGSGGSLFAITPGGTRKWQSILPAVPVTASPAFGQFVFNVGALNAIDTIIYLVDPQGTAYPIRDATGMRLQIQRCSDDITEDCRIDSCPPGLTCSSSNVCTSATGPTTMACSQDTCLPTGVCLVRGRCNDPLQTPCFVNSCEPGGEPDAGMCASDSMPPLCTASKKPCLPAPDTCPDDACNSATNTCTGSDAFCLSIQCPSGGVCQTVDSFSVAGTNTVQVATSPALSADPFVVIGTADGRVCASWLDGSMPSNELSSPPTTPTPNPWNEGGGCVDLGPNRNRPTLSSPIIGPNGTIYVTTADGLYKIQ
jgi:outer membrane protein assembly factor BamB